jgi:hypothetical protein
MARGEAELLQEILRELSKGDVRLFRQNAGLSYQGRVIEQTPMKLILAPWYPIRLGVEGISDLIGWSPLDGHAIYTAIEAKSLTGRVRPAQRAFIEIVKKCGGRAGIARSVEDAGKIIHGIDVTQA